MFYFDFQVESFNRIAFHVYNTRKKYNEYTVYSLNFFLVLFRYEWLFFGLQNSMQAHGEFGINNNAKVQAKKI